MGAVTNIGIPFTQPLNKPLSTAGQFQVGCYLVFTVGGSLATVYRDPALQWPHKQTSVSGSGPGFAVASTTGIVSDATGRFPAIYLNPALTYSYGLYTPQGALLEAGPANGVNVANTQCSLQASKISTTTQAANTSLTGYNVLPDPDLQIALGVGVYRLEIDLIWFASSATSTLKYGIYYSGSLSANAANNLLVFGVLDGSVFTYTKSVANQLISSYVINTVPNNNTVHAAGTIQTTTPGTLSVNWVSVGGSLLSLGAGSALYATPL